MSNQLADHGLTDEDAADTGPVVSGLADTMAAVARSLSVPPTLQQTLDLVVQTALDVVPGVQHAGIWLVRSGGRFETVASSDARVLELDRLQLEVGEGPCLGAVRGETRRVSDSLAEDERWPAFGPRAAELGVRSQLGTNLDGAEGLSGGLNLYADRPAVFDDEAVHAAELLAEHASRALEASMRREQMDEAVRTRTAIGQATGLAMARYGLDSTRAFHFLVRVSQQQNVKLRELAGRMVAEHDSGHRAEPGDGGEPGR